MDINETNIKKKHFFYNSIKRNKAKSCKDNYKIKVLALFLFMMVDYIATYVGINVFGVIEEANPLFVWLFETSFIYGFIFRFIYSSIIAWLCIIVGRADYKYKNQFINVGLLVNIIIAALHIRWFVISFIN